MSSVRVERSYVNGRFGQMHVYRAGPDHEPGRMPLLCIHLTPLAAVVYSNFLTEMGRDRLAIAIDTPGYGNSDPPPAPPSIADYTSALFDALDTLGIDRLDVMGIHTGSKIALDLARSQPHRVNRIVWVSIAYWSASEMVGRDVYSRPPDNETDGSHIAGLWREIVRWSTPGRTPEQIAETFYTSQLQPEISHWGYRAAFPYDVEQAMAEIGSSKPVLVLNPDDDLRDHTPRIRPLLLHPHSRFVDLPGWGHGFLDLKTAEAAAIIRVFLDQDSRVNQGSGALLTPEY